MEALDGNVGVPRLDVPLTCMKCGHTDTLAEGGYTMSGSHRMPLIPSPSWLRTSPARPAGRYRNSSSPRRPSKPSRSSLRNWVMRIGFSRLASGSRRSSGGCSPGRSGERLSARSSCSPSLARIPGKGEAYRLLRLGHAYYTANRFAEASVSTGRPSTVTPHGSGVRRPASTLERREQVQEAITVLETGANTAGHRRAGDRSAGPPSVTSSTNTLVSTPE